MAMTSDRIDAIGRVFKIIQNASAVKKKLVYTVRPSGVTSDKSIADLRKLSYWVGFQGIGETMTLDEMVVTIQTVFDQIEQVQHLKPVDGQISVQTKMHLEPDDATIQDVIDRIVFAPLSN